jgi:uncharacterized membrane protein
VPGDPNLRASDADRDRVASLLREHHAAGRLTAQEFHDRVDKALEAKTLGELDALLKDLPSIDLYRLPDASLRRPPSGGGLPAQFRTDGGDLVSPGALAWSRWAMVSGGLFAIWLVSVVIVGGAAWIPWFLFVAIPWAMALLRRRGGR